MSGISRRSMIRTATLVPLAAKIGCARRVSPARDLAVAAPIDGDVTIPLAGAPELTTAGGAILARPQGQPDAYLVAYTGAGYLALRAQCPHQGCDVTWVAEDRQAECPCHGSRFAGDGTVLNPPATTDLPAYPAEADGQGNVVVHLFAGDGSFPDKVRNGQCAFPVAHFPALANVGGIVLGRPDGFPTPLLLTRLASGSGPDAIAAIDAVCTHLGCTVLPAPPILQCPCHDSRFDLAGKFITGAAGADLIRYPVQFDGTTVTISTAPIA